MILIAQQMKNLHLYYHYHNDEDYDDHDHNAADGSFFSSSSDVEKKTVNIVQIVCCRYGHIEGGEHDGELGF